MKKETRWLILHIVSVCTAAFAIAISVDMSGYKADGFLAIALGAVILVLCMTFASLAMKALRLPVVREADIKQFDFAEHKPSVVSFLFAPHAISYDPKNNITIHSVLYKCVSSPFIKLLPVAVGALVFLKSIIDAGAISFINTFFLLVQSLIVMVAVFITTMIILQIPAILKYAKLVSKNPQSDFIESLKLLIFGKSKRKTPPAIEVKSISSADKYLHRVYDARSVLNPTTGERYMALYKATTQTESEIYSVVKEFNIPLSTFSDELLTINEISNVFFPATLDSFDKTFKNTQMRTELTQVFRAKVDKNILSKIQRYEDALELIRMKLLETRLSPFDTSLIDSYVTNIHMLHQKIKTQSGSVANKHFIISQSIISDLLPSLINTWEVANNEEDRVEVQSHFEQLTAFLESQLTALDSTNISTSDPLLLTLDSGVSLGNNELHQQISKNGRYIKSLVSNWH